MLLAELTVKDLAGVFPNVTSVMLEKFCPVIVTVPLAAPAIALKEVITGGGAYANTPVPPGFVTAISPIVAAPKLTVMLPGELLTKSGSELSPTLTLNILLKLLPLITRLFTFPGPVK